MSIEGFNSEENYYPHPTSNKHKGDVMRDLELDVCDSDGSEKVKPPSETEIVAELIAALEMSNYEFLTLKARLGGPFQRNAQACYDRGSAAVKAAKNYYETKET